MAEGGMRDIFYAPRRTGEIRPRPNVALRKGAKFAMCNGTTCRGESCTFAHSPEEMRIWNSQLSDLDDLPHQVPQQQPFVLDESDFPSFPSHNQHYFGPTAPKPNSFQNSSPWQPPLNFGHQQEIHSTAWPAVQYPGSAIRVDNLESDYFSGHTSSAYMPPAQTSATYVTGHTAATYRPFRPSNVEPPPFPEFVDWTSAQEPSRREKRSPSKTEQPLYERESISGPDPLYAKLSSKNYASKYRRLVEVEKTAHEGILRERCNGDSIFTLLGSHCPDPLIKKVKYPDNYQQYAQLDNISSDNLAYVRQACTSVTLSTRLREDYKANIIDRLDKKLIIAFGKGAKSPPRKGVIKVTFNLKESYFDDMLRAVKSLSASMIERIMPSSKSFKSMAGFYDVHMFESYCSSEQLEALRVMASCPSSGPPILLTGAFGTGKSRLLALSVHYFQTLQTHLQPIRVLVCTQQRISADKFLEYYDQVWVDTKKGRCFVIREYAMHEVKPEYQGYYKSSKDFEKVYMYQSSNCDNLLLITTCLTAPHLAFLPTGYFTHILIDEGSMMREPEAIAPLFLADANTKIIIAGDANQVGPAMLVLGDLAKSNGLSVSLLQRLEKLYMLCDGNRNIATLSTNYRCHPLILDLVGGLFYQSSIKWNEDETPPATHRNFPFPLVFVCSSIDEDIGLSSDHDNNEATTVFQKVMEVAKGCPSSWAKYPTSDFFVISPSEEQVYLLRTKFKRAAIPPPEVKSSQAIQGREFRAIFLSTSELVHEDGSSRNPVRSLCDPYVFNTAITRAKSLVVSVGNPFLLLNMEKKMMQLYGQEHNAHCWSTYLNLCLHRGTVEFAQHLKLTIEQQANTFAKLKQMIENVNDQIRNSSELLDKEDLEKKVEQLELELEAKEQELTMRNRSSGQLQQPDISLPPTPYFPFPIDPNTGSTFPPAFPYLYNTALPPQDNVLQPPLNLPHEMAHLPPGFGNPPSSYAGPPVHGSSHRVMEDIEDPESSVNQDSFPTEMTLKPSNDQSYSDVQRISPTTEDGPWNPNHYHEKTSANSSVLEESAGSISGNDRSYKKEGKLGSGGFGVVYHVSEWTTGNNYALKVIKLHDNELVDHPKRLREVEALKKLSHDNIVLYEDHWIEEACREWWSKRNMDEYRNLKTCLFILTELCQPTTLKDWLAEHSGEGSRNRKNMSVFFEQIVNGLVFIHQNHFTHRDLKPSNIFFGRFDKEKLKIGDFGLVLIEHPSKTNAATDTSADMERPSTYSTQRGGGTYPYMSPEQQDPDLRPSIDCKTDIYSLGIILFELHYPKKTLQEDRSRVFGKVREGMFPAAFKERMPKVHEAIKKMTKRSSKQRPSASEVQKHILTDLTTMNRKTRRACVPVL